MSHATISSTEVKQGEVVGIIGRNGTGKTTLLKILSRIPACAGHGRQDRADRGAGGGIRPRGLAAEVGPGFHPELTGRESIYLNGAIPSICLRPELRPRAQDKPGDEEGGDLS